MGNRLLDRDAREDELLGVLELLTATDGARGRERAAAEALAGYAAPRWPEIDWRVEPVGDPAGPCAQLVASAGEPAPAGLLLYSHLDTSLTGDPAVDAAVTGRPVAAHGFQIDPVARTVRGPGLGVARGPAAAALVGFVRAAARLREGARPFGLRLLLAARGTHRAADWSRFDDVVPEPPLVGVSAFLARHPRPAAAVVAKGGPDGVLHDEPGACYLRVRVRAGWGALMSRERLRPEGGLLAHLGVLVGAIETAGAALVAAAPESPQAGAQFGIGAVRSGLPGKPDLAPGLVDVYCYLVTPGAIPSGAPARSLAARVRAGLAGTVLDGVELTVTDQVIHAGGCTAADAAVVRATVQAYQGVHGRPPQEITGWTGSTDGVVLRAAGIPTARVGPSATTPVGDGSDVADLDELVAYSRIYEQIATTMGTAADADSRDVPGVDPTMSHLT